MMILFRRRRRLNPLSLAHHHHQSLLFLLELTRQEFVCIHLEKRELKKRDTTIDFLTNSLKTRKNNTKNLGLNFAFVLCVV